MHPDRQAAALNPRSDREGNGSTRGRGGRGRGGARGGARGASSSSQGLPGGVPSGSISKLKAQLRQTKRLLARDDLTPDVRTTSERRMKTLDLELEKAEQSALEQKMVTRYRGVRFFERQKLLRKIKQAKKALLAEPENEVQNTLLLDSRVDLYYVLRYPKTTKYIALFPEGTYVPHSPPPPAETPPTDALAKRHALRATIRKKLASGELPAEPESGELGIEGEEDVPLVGEEGEASGKRGREETQQERPSKKSKSTPAAAAPPMVVAAASKPVSKPTPAPSALTPASVVESPAPAPAPQATERAGTRQTKKEKKDAKDAKRRANKEAAEAKKGGEGAGATTSAEAGTTAGVEAPVAEEKGKEGWAGEDDFFA